MQQLTEACRDHSMGRLSRDLTIQVCWDADRLDLGRLDKGQNTPTSPQILLVTQSLWKRLLSAQSVALWIMIFANDKPFIQFVFTLVFR